MNKSRFKHWIPALNEVGRQPAYLLIADLIASDLDRGLLQPRDKLPTLRDLASDLELNYTTVARAYNEARARGLIDTHPGRGTFVRGQTSSRTPTDGSDVQMTMNSPPEPQNLELQRKINHGFQRLANAPDVYAMFRYQDFGGQNTDKEAGLKLLSRLIEKPKRENILVCPGIHSILVGLLSQLADERSIVCAQNLTYPGLKAIAAQLGITLYSMTCDNEGPLIRPLEEYCKKERVAAFHLNPTIQNPTAFTMSRSRRESIAQLALKYSIPIIEDDAYGFLPEKPVSPIANLAPELTYYINGLAKCFGAGIRTAYLHAPNKQAANRFAGTMRSLSVMASSVTTALATGWIMDDTFDQMASEIRKESSKRYQIAQKHLSDFKFNADPEGFHLWLSLPKTAKISAPKFAENARGTGINAVASAAFCTDNNPPDAIRICLGGASNLEQCEDSVLSLKRALNDLI